MFKKSMVLVGVLFFTSNTLALDLGELRKTEYILYFIINIAKEHNFAPELLISLIEQESHFKPYAIHIRTPEVRIGYIFRKRGINYKFYQKRHFYHYSIDCKNIDDALYILKTVQAKEEQSGQSFSYDIGLLQINSAKAKDYGVELTDLLLPGFNIFIGSIILQKCSEKYQELAPILECYHRGENTNVQHSAYSKSVLQRYTKFMQ